MLRYVPYVYRDAISAVEPVLGHIWHAKDLPRGIHTTDTARLCDAAGRHDAVDVAHAHAQATAIIAQLEPVHRACGEHALVGIGGRFDVANLGAAKVEFLRGGGQVKGWRGEGVKVVVAQKGGGDFLRGDGEVGGGAGEGVGGVGLVVRLGEGGGCDASGGGRDWAGCGWVHEVERDGLVPEHGRGKIGIRGGGIESRGVVQDREGACVDGGSVVGGASVVLDAMANGKILEGEICSRRGKVSCCEMVSHKCLILRHSRRKRLLTASAW